MFSSAKTIFGVTFGLSAMVSTSWAQEVGGRPDRPTEKPAELPILKVPKMQGFVEAAYPPEAKAQGLEATVGLAVEINADGAVQRVEVVRPAGHGFDEAAIAALEETRFTPAENAEGAIGVVIEFDYNFVLQDAEPVDSDLPINLEGTIRRMGDRSIVAGATISIMVQGEKFDCARALSHPLPTNQTTYTDQARVAL